MAETPLNDNPFVSNGPRRRPRKIPVPTILPVYPAFLPGSPAFVSSSSFLTPGIAPASVASTSSTYIPHSPDIIYDTLTGSPDIIFDTP